MELEAWALIALGFGAGCIFTDLVYCSRHRRRGWDDVPVVQGFSLIETLRRAKK